MTTYYNLKNNTKQLIVSLLLTYISFISNNLKVLEMSFSISCFLQVVILLFIFLVTDIFPSILHYFTF